MAEPIDFAEMEKQVAAAFATADARLRDEIERAMFGLGSDPQEQLGSIP